jgi:hypothetical protein
VDLLPTPDPETLCRCGCGTPLRSVGAFEPGHHMRVTPRRSNGQALPIREWGALTASLRLDDRTRVCLSCGEEFHMARRTHSYCSPACAGAGRRKLTAWNELQRRVLSRIRQDRISLQAFARQSGLPFTSLQTWFQRKGSTVSGSTIDQLARALDISFPRALREAGGVTAEEQRAKSIRAKADSLEPETRSRIARNARRARRTLTWSEASIKKRRATRESNGADDRQSARAQKYNSTLRGQVMSRLGGQLRLAPPPTREHPTRAQIEGWLSEIAAELGEEVRLVRAAARDYLQRKGIYGAGGRPRHEKRHALILNEVLARGLTPGGPKPRGFWKDIVDITRSQIGSREPGSGGQQRYWAEHLGTCTECATFR